MSKLIISPRRKTTQQFIIEATIKHGNIYDYSKVSYVGKDIKVEIICQFFEHGSFWQTPHSHLMGRGCPACARLKTTAARKSLLTTEIFIKKATDFWGDRYDYSRSVCEDSSKKLIVICRNHGPFETLPHSHIAGHGCPICANELNSVKNTMGYEEFVRRAKLKHNNKYEYPFFVYKKSSFKAPIICPLHGLFHQLANDHLAGRGCSVCSDSTGELAIAEVLDLYSIRYEKEKNFPDLRDKGRLRFDFWLPDLNTVIEYHGWQHFKPVDFFGGEIGFKNAQRRDQIKRDWCFNHGVKLIEIAPNNNAIEDLIKLMLGSN